MLLRNRLIRLAHAHPELRSDLLPIIRLARSYDEYVEDFTKRKENKGKEPQSKEEWASEAEKVEKGESRLKKHKIDTKALRGKMPSSFTDEAWSNLQSKLGGMSDEDFDKAAEKLKKLSESKDPKPADVADWGGDVFGGKTKSWLQEMDEKDQKEEIGLFGNAMAIFFDKLYAKIHSL